MSITPEREKLQPEVVALNQEFYAFDPRRTIQTLYGKLGFYEFKREIILETGVLPHLPIELSASIDTEVPKSQTLTPFNPESGYTITQEDFSLETRRKKINDIGERELNEEEFAKAPLLITAECDEEKFKKAKLYYRPYELSLKVENVLRRLRLLLIFPNGSLEGKSDTSDGILFFIEFYPIDDPPIPTGGEYPLNTAGFLVHVPSNIEKLSQIRAKFILVDDKQ